MSRVWSCILDSCPGLLCCVINLRGKLVYASKGYKSVAAKFFGHKCKEGNIYPPMATEFDMALHEVLTAACLGETNAVEFSGQNRIWEITASPLRIESKTIEGVVIRLTSTDKNNLSPVILSDPEIINSVPFRACIVDFGGEILAANKFLTSCSKKSLIGKNITEIILPSSLLTQKSKSEYEKNLENLKSELTEIIKKRSGSIECRISDYHISRGENFYDFDTEIYLDKDFNNSDEDKNEKNENHESRLVKIHASSVKWNDNSDCTMLTFEDITDYRRTHEQLKRLLTFDSSTGVLNRRGMIYAITREISNSIRESVQLSLIIMNIDNFKALNEKNGYMSGNRILHNFVNMAKKFVSEHSDGIFAHWDVDEFMMIVHCSGAAAVVLADEIRAKAEYMKISAGVADLISGVYAGTNDFIAAAYDAMTEAKNSGGDKTVLAKNS